MAWRRSSPTKAKNWREPSRAVREARFASHHCRGPAPPQSCDISRIKHASAKAQQRAHSAFRVAASVPTSSHRLAAPDERVHTVVVGLAGTSAAYRRGCWEDRPARSAVDAAAVVSQHGALLARREPGNEAPGSLDQPNERTSALDRRRAPKLDRAAKDISSAHSEK